MIKKAILLLLASVSIAGVSNAQFCGTVEKTEQIKKQHPEIASYEVQAEQQIKANLKNLDLRKLMRFHAGDTLDTIPVVVHVIHDYGTENVSDDKIFTMLDNLNTFYQLKNDTSRVVDEFRKYVGNVHFVFKLATKDPNGNPTKGITRRYSYLTYGHDDQAKLDLWNPASYMNIWVESFIGQGSEGGGIVAAYAYMPPTAAAIPYYDGVMTNSQFITTVGNDDGATIPHEVGHYFNLLHTFGMYNEAGQANGVPCGDDEVDDTPPTYGEQFTCPLNDKSCVIPYFKLYPSSVPGVDSLVDYPDTANVQNIMNYAGCKNMFTKGQAARMRAAAQSTVANRDSLFTDFNYFVTGINNSTPDLAPIADFSVQNNNLTSVPTPTRSAHYFLCAGSSSSFYFKNQSWNDTLSSLTWIFSNNATTPTTTVTSAFAMNTPIKNSFNTPGWVKVTLVATSNAGTDTLVRDHAVYAADPTGVQPIGYFQEFNTDAAGNDVDKWPMFNYYGNNYKWELVKGIGAYDNYCVRYDGYDTRSGLATVINTPNGDFDDMFTPAFDLSGLASGNCNLNFLSAGAFLTGNTFDMNDTLEIDYSTSCGNNWTVLKNLTKSDLVSAGSTGDPYIPAWNQWKLNSIDIPVSARTSSTFFRFRYHPGIFINGSQFGSGNYFYLDRFNISNNPLSVSTVIPGEKGIVLAPNPTHNGTSVLIKENGTSTSAHIIVTDITGKVVYNVTEQLNGSENKIDIPASALQVKGMYLVQVVTNEQNQTEKLVVY